MTPARWLLVWALVSTGCFSVVTSRPLPSRIETGEKPLGFYLSTGDAPYPYRTLGFVQLNAYGATAAGYVDLGDAALSTVLNQKLMAAAGAMGGQAVIFVEFEDPDAPTEAERAMQLVQSVSVSVDATTGAGRTSGSSVKERTVVVTGQVIQWSDR